MYGVVDGIYVKRQCYNLFVCLLNFLIIYNIFPHSLYYYYYYYYYYNVIPHLLTCSYLITFAILKTHHRLFFITLSNYLFIYPRFLLLFLFLFRSLFLFPLLLLLLLQSPPFWFFYLIYFPPHCINTFPKLLQ
ncbi:uncharacterized protein SCDLUD_002360 [Saccharomycodes ludwigii]|uniref:uncharacterized protein n=1 Tax=Saccharomycodes ludwigii TaxID=36035 RepID=UPI001E82F0F5|nr:hypothetical protein SCDLUD_002360 [Saccharomycodes ludwigii]KAH3900900.1 hypothetical protein SCDLUD_002360 [Saccharomycodes ludwigii]